MTAQPCPGGEVPYAGRRHTGGMTSADRGSDPFHDPEPSLGGDTIDEAVENAEEGTQAEDTGHTPSGNEPSGESRAEQMRDVVEHDED
jgi:hypothetical protein